MNEGRCERCLSAWPNPEGCPKCNPEPLADEIEVLRGRVRELEDAVAYAEGHANSAEEDRDVAEHEATVYRRERDEWKSKYEDLVEVGQRVVSMIEALGEEHDLGADAIAVLARALP